MEEIKDFENAWEGDLVDWRGKTYRVLTVHYDTGFKILRVVNPNPLFPFTRVREIYE